MSTVTIWETSSSAEQTERVGERLGRNLRGGEVIELVSDLGGGKTTFTRGLVRGVGSTDRVGSPTFTLNREYKAPKFTVAHFDFYRLGEAGIMGDELDEIIHDDAYVTVVEWGDIVHDVLPEKRLTVQLEQAGGDTRKISITCPTELSYTLEGVDL